MTARAPAAPPELRGFTYRGLLGSGGFADVFLYEQQMPRRQVAVKVLLADVVTDAVRRQFHDEANLMAQVSTHPSIVSVYQADIADDGRPYLVMEYCPRANLAVRYRQERMGVAEVLRIGVRLAAAVETAHRTGILHRDIKPANVLTTEYGWPALTDFGISTGTGTGAEAAGMSIPWSAPEVFAEPPVSDERSDVYALGATVYTLLARRSPFEQPGGRNGAMDLVTRIERDPLPPLGRDDVPASLEEVLKRSTAKRSASRYRTALELARALQQVEIELQLAPTTIDVLEPAVGPEPQETVEDDGLTRIRGLVTIDPSGPVGSTVLRSAVGPTVPEPEPPTLGRLPATVPERPAAPSLPVPPVESTVHRPATPAAAPATDPEPSTGRRPAVLVGAAVALLAVIGVGAVLATSGDDTGTAAPAGSTEALAPADDDALLAVVPAPADLTGTPGEGGTTFTWSNPDPEDGDAYLWSRVDPGQETPAQPVAEPTVTVSAPGRVCIEVLVRRANGRASAPTQGCTA